ncbi:MAG: arsenic resistance N-acetyltransferase ArsN2 [Woeseiaceae bacterium]
MRAATETDLSRLTTLLADNDLPTDDLPTLDMTWFKVVEQAGKIVAAGGLEPVGDFALLRSLVTDKRARGLGLAGQLVTALEQLASDRNIETLYLLTTTAEDYFQRRGYDVCERESVPAAIKASAQFSSLCPDSAAVMRKVLAG